MVAAGEIFQECQVIKEEIHRIKVNRLCLEKVWKDLVSVGKLVYLTNRTEEIIQMETNRCKMKWMVCKDKYKYQLLMKSWLNCTKILDLGRDIKNIVELS